MIRLLSFFVPLLLAGVSASAQESVVYKTIGETKLALNFYKPEGWKASEKRPAIVFFFGGGWSGGSTKQFHEHSKHLANRGMVAFTAEYRIKNKHDSTPLDSTADAKDAVRWIREHAGELGIDPDRLAAGGGSAGGHLAAATATVPFANKESTSAVPNALLLFNPATNVVLEKLREKWGDDVYAKIETISPLQHVTGDLPPTIIFHGTGDTAVPYQTAVDFTEKAKSLGAKKVELVRYDGRPHGFFNVGRGDGKDFDDTLNRSDAFLVELGWLKPKAP